MHAAKHSLRLRVQEGNMQSMTGFGRGVVCREGREVVVELKSVNHRFLDISVRAPRVFLFAEDAIKKEISGFFARGHIDVFVNYRNMREDSRTVAVDEGLLSQYIRAFERLQACGLEGTLTQQTAAALPDVLTVTAEQEDQEALEALVRQAVKEACMQMYQMRRAEGECMKNDLLAKLNTVQHGRDEIARLSDSVAKELSGRMRLRIQELLGETPVDEQRLLQEIAIASDRLAIDEEVVRLQVHINNMRIYMEANEPQGRKLEFMLQEVGREVNTIGSKAMNTEIQSIVVELKGELEKLREQVQNVE